MVVVVVGELATRQSPARVAADRPAKSLTYDLRGRAWFNRTFQAESQIIHTGQEERAVRGGETLRFIQAL